MMVFIADERLHLGAEAEVWSGTWMGRSAVSKQRRSRQWRHPNLDKRLGVRRMVSEAKILMRLHNAGIAVPQVWDLDVQGGRLVLQRMPGIPLIELLNNAETSEQLVIKALRNTGAAIRILHRQAITHGDLSTNNILIDEQGNAVLIDFGLAVIDYEVERFGIDLHVIDEILSASHPNHHGAIELVLSAYREEEQKLGTAPEQSGGVVPTAEEVLERFENVKSRVRYHG